MPVAYQNCANTFSSNADATGKSAVAALLVSDVVVNESEDAVIRIQASQVFQSDLVLQWDLNSSATNPAADFAMTQGSVTLSVGAASLEFSIPTVNDALSESLKQFIIRFQDASGTVADFNGSIVLTDDEGQPAIVIGDAGAQEGSTAVFRISMNKTSGSDVTVNYATMNGTAGAPGDFAAASGTVTIAAGGSLAEIRIPIFADAISESTESFSVVLSGAMNAVIADSSGAGAIFEPSAMVATVAGGIGHTCAIMNGGLRCWGDNGSGEVGDGTAVQRRVPVQVSGLDSGVSAVSTGGNHTCAIHNGALKCWGGNGSGQLGDGTVTSRSAATQVSGMDTNVTAIAAGTAFTCALTGVGALKCWGNNANGQLGDGTVTNRNAPYQVFASGVSNVKAGANHVCAIRNGGLLCWGLNSSGQLGDGTAIARRTPTFVAGLETGVSDLAVGDTHTCAIHNGALRCWGSNASGELGDGSVTPRLAPTIILASGVSAIAGGDRSTCGIINNVMKCWGLGTSGQIGENAVVNRSVPTDVMGLNAGVTAIAIMRAGQHRCALHNGQLKCWGLGTSGQLGDNTIVSKRVPTNVQ